MTSERTTEPTVEGHSTCEQPLPDGGDAQNGADDTGSESGGGEATVDVPGELIYETTPTIKPTLILMGLTFVVGMLIEVYLLNNPEAVGGRDAMEVLLYVVAFLLAVSLLRFLVRMLVLERTTYQITDEVVRREYKLLFRHLSREVPLDQLKAHELRRNRIQALLGYGTVRFLTGGTNESLGFVEFENLIEPVEVRGIIRDILP